jgi:hypothetical protein
MCVCQSEWRFESEETRERIDAPLTVLLSQVYGCGGFGVGHEVGEGDVDILHDEEDVLFGNDVCLVLRREEEQLVDRASAACVLKPEIRQ